MASLRDSIRELLVPAFRMHEAYARELVGDLDEAQLDQAPGPGLENTPRFTIGHLCCATAMTVRLLEHPDDDRSVELDLPAGYQELFGRMGPGDRRTPEASASAPSAEDLLAEFARQHAKVEAALERVEEAELAKACEWKLGAYLPRVADVVTFQCVHEMLHLGQLAAWRRAMGLPAAMARMAER